MRFDPAAIAEIHARLDIARVIGDYVPLKKRGNDLVGLCPFHGEKTPSFHVHPDRGFFKCFGCGAGGDAIAFVQRIENVPFADAVRTLAAKAGVELEPENPRAARARNEREAIYDANRIAAAYFARMLASDAGRRARAYCAQRGITEETAGAFALGYAPDSWSGLVDELERQGVDLSVAASAGLVKPGQRGYYDFYRDRLMVPTYSTTGEVIAFGGRALGDAEPKYLNTTTTPVYVKGRHLFALNVARRAAQADRTLIVVEGYLDCIALHQAGFKNAVAALGTAFTPEQATELRKYADYVYLCFDGDAAGSAAATKAVDIASKSIEHAGSAVRIAMLPPGQDPDGFVRDSGAEAFRKLLDDAKPAIAFRIDAEIERLRAGFDSPATLAPRAEVLIREMAPREEWDRWRVYVAGRLQVSADDLRNSRFLANSANFAPRSEGSSRQPARACIDGTALFRTRGRGHSARGTGAGRGVRRAHRSGAISQRSLPANIRAHRGRRWKRYDHGRRFWIVWRRPSKPRRAGGARGARSQFHGPLQRLGRTARASGAGRRAVTARRRAEAIRGTFAVDRRGTERRSPGLFADFATSSTHWSRN